MPFPVDVALIHEAERQLGRKLPMDLRVRLHRENGGEVRALGDMWRLFPVFDASDRRRIARTANHIVREKGRGNLHSLDKRQRAGLTTAGP
jgi:hypothetical protein